MKVYINGEYMGRAVRAEQTIEQQDGSMRVNFDIPDFRKHWACPDCGSSKIGNVKLEQRLEHPDADEANANNQLYREGKI